MKRDLSRGDKLVALATESGEPLPIAEVSKITGLSPRQVVRCRQRLVEAGELVVIDPGGSRRPARYQRPGGASCE